MSACPAPALSLRPTSWGRKKVLYGRYYRFGHKYAYCNGDPIDHSDPSGLDMTGGFDAALSRVNAGLIYFGGLGEKGLNCAGGALGGLGLNPKGGANYRGGDVALAALKKNGYSVVQGAPRIGDTVVFGAHFATVVDIVNGRAIIYGQDGTYGKYAGTLAQYDKAGAAGALQGFYRGPGSSTNSQIQEYKNLKAAHPNGVDLPLTAGNVTR
jgi:hypothetical protein